LGGRPFLPPSRGRILDRLNSEVVAANETSRSARPLDITHVTTFYPPTSFGGDAVYVQRLARAQARRGHNVRVVHAPLVHGLLAADAAASVSGADEGVDVREVRAGGRLEPLLVYLTGRPVFSRGQLTECLSGTGSGAPAVTHFHNPSLIAGPGGLRLGRGVVFYTPHEYWLVCPTHMLYRFGREICTRRTCVRCTVRAGRPPQPWRYGSAVERGLEGVDRILYPSQLCADVHARHGIETESSVFPHFIPDDYLRRAREAGPRSSDAPPYLLYVGRLEPVKGITGLLEAHAEHGIETPLWVAGDGGLATELRKRFGRDPRRVRFLGQQDEQALHDLYRDAAGVILPSAGHEVFGLVIAEAFAHGTPALVPHTGAGKDLVEASGGGFVYADGQELAAQVARLVADPDERTRVGERGRRFAAGELSEAAYMERYEALVDAVVRP
jgi:glycosyltransferase involved in cell wall biosynthesis